MGGGQPCSLVSLHPCPWWQIQTDAGVTGTGWLGESATLPDHALLGSRRGSASCLVLLGEVGPVGPAPDCLPSHHHPMAGGLTHAASSSTGSGDLGKKAETAWRKAIAPVLRSGSSSSYLPCPGTCLCLCLLCSSVYPCHALPLHRANELHYDIKNARVAPG